MTQTSKLENLSGLKIQNNEKENISLTLSMQFDTFIARGQGQENKNLVFLPPHFFRQSRLAITSAKAKELHSLFYFLFWYAAHLLLPQRNYASSKACPKLVEGLLGNRYSYIPRLFL